MPSLLHEALVRLFQNRPQLAAEMLLDALHVTLPEYTDIRLDSANLTDLAPAEYRADLVAVLLDRKPVQGIIVEVQLSEDNDKWFAWPAYVANLRARLRCPVCLLVVARTDTVAKWAARPLEMGGGNYFTPLVLAPSDVPEVMDAARACADPELAILSAIAHAEHVDPSISVRVACAAISAISGVERLSPKLYIGLIKNSLSSATREALHAMGDQIRAFADIKFEGEIYELHYSAGVAKGEQAGRAFTLIRLLEKRFGMLPPEIQNEIRDFTTHKLDAIFDRLLKASDLADALQRDLRPTPSDPR